MMPTAERKHINVLKRAIDEQIGVRLLEMQHDDPSARQIKVNTLKEKFKNDNAFDDTAYYIVDCYVHALKWNNPEPEIILPLKEIKIGNQIWANRNLDVSYFRSGAPIPEARNNEEWKAAGENEHPAWCYYDNDPENGKIYGKLYNWYAVNDPRRLAPEGWHVPNDDVWTELTDFSGGEEKAGQKLKSANGWQDNGNSTDEFGFTALPGGGRDYDGAFYGVGILSRWWSATEGSTNYAWGRGLGCVSSYVSRGGYDKELGFSVRCLRDSFI